MSEDNTKVTDLSTEQQKAIIDTKEVLASKQDVLMAIGQVQAFNNIRKYATVAEIITYRRIKESKQYKGLVFIDDDGKSVTVSCLEDVCTYFFKRSIRSMQRDEENLEAFGQEFLESAQNMGLGYRELAKLRQLPEQQQLAVINSEEVDLGDKTAVKELIEDFVIQHNNEKVELKKQVEDVKTNLDVAREMSSEKDQELNSLKEQEAKRRFSQEPWQRQTLDNVNAMLEARGSIAQANNQLIDVLNNLSQNDELDDKAIDHIARSLLSEVQHNLTLLSQLTSDAFAILGSKYSPDLTIDELFNQLHLEQPFNDAVEA